jgi:hypothetical protein
VAKGAIWIRFAKQFSKALQTGVGVIMCTNSPAHLQVESNFCRLGWKAPAPFWKKQERSCRFVWQGVEYVTKLHSENGSADSAHFSIFSQIFSSEKAPLNFEAFLTSDFFNEKWQPV